MIGKQNEPKSSIFVASLSIKIPGYSGTIPISCSKFTLINAKPPSINHFPTGFLHWFSASTLVYWRLFHVHTSFPWTWMHRQRHLWSSNGAVHCYVCGMLHSYFCRCHSHDYMTVAFMPPCLVLQWAQMYSSKEFQQRNCVNLQDGKPLVERTW